MIIPLLNCLPCARCILSILFELLYLILIMGFTGGSDGKESACNVFWVQSLGWEDPLEEGMAAHSSVLARRIPMDRGAWRATVRRVTESQTQLSD